MKFNILAFTAVTSVAAQATFTLPPGIVIPGVTATELVVPTGISPGALSAIVSSLTSKVGATLQPSVLASVAAENGIPFPFASAPVTTTLTGTLTPVVGTETPTSTAIITETPSSQGTTGTSATATSTSTSTSTGTVPSQSEKYNIVPLKWIFPIVGLYLLARE